MSPTQPHPASEIHRRFPNDPFFTCLLSTAARHYNHVVVNDPARHMQADYTQLLRDVSILRQTLCESLSENIVDRSNGMVRGQGVRICILAPGSYQFIVALLATTAIGAAAVLLPTGLIPEEALYLYNKCDAVCVLVAPEMESLVIGIREYARQIKQEHNAPIKSIPIEIQQNAPTTNHKDYSITPNLSFPSSQPALVLFTSGSTGPPKCVLHTRKLLYGLVEACDAQITDVVLLHRPAFWVAGLRPFLSMLPNGVRLEIFSPGSQSDLLWDRLREGDITILACQAIVWQGMMKVFEEKIKMLPDQEVQEYIQGAEGLRIAQCSGGMPAVAVKQFWKDLRNGRGLDILYNTTELGLPPLQTFGGSPVDKRVIGQPTPGVTVKLSEGNQGELLVKSSCFFSHYIGDTNATKAMFDDEGFFKTGDFAYLDGKDYVIEGRAKSDVIRFFGYKVLTYEVEERLNELAYISEAYVLSVPSADTVYRVAAIVRLRRDHLTQENNNNLSLKTLRDDLSSSLSLYKQPSLLRILNDDETVPTTRTVKFDHAEAAKRYFTPGMDWGDRVQVWDMSGLQDAMPQKAWDLAGMRV